MINRLSVAGSSQWRRVYARPDPAVAGRMDENRGKKWWRVTVVRGEWWPVAREQWPVAREIEEAETTVIRKRPNEASLPMMLTIGRL